jgi:tRNA(adenine34) deaminase
VWQELALPWKTAVTQAIEALRAGSLAIGAAICLPDGIPLCAGRNRILEPPATDGTVSGSTVAHAEINALVALSLCPAQPPQTILSLYSTAEPCPMCIGAIAMSRVKHVHFASRDTWAGSTDLVDKSQFMRRKVLSVTGPTDERLEAVLIALHAYSHLRRRSGGGRDAVLSRWAEFCPVGIALAERLGEDERLRSFALSDIPPGDLMDRLADLTETA